jgi:hypothetical protein
MGIRVHHAKTEAGAWDDFAGPTIVEADHDIFAYYLANTDYLTEADRPASVQWNDVLMGNDDDVVTPNEDHIELAQKIKRFYRDRIMMRRLTGKTTSHFQNSVYKFATSETPNQIDVEAMGLMIKLPEFYEYDRKIDHLAETYNSKIETANNQQILRDPETHTLTLVERTQRKTKTTKDHEFWFIDENNHVNKLTVEIANPLVHLLERYIKMKNNVLDVNAYYYYTQHQGYDNFHYYDLAHWTIQ